MRKVFKNFSVNLMLDKDRDAEKIWRRGKLTCELRVCRRNNQILNQEMEEVAEQAPESDLTCKICFIRTVKYAEFLLKDSFLHPFLHLQNFRVILEFLVVSELLSMGLYSFPEVPACPLKEEKN